MCLASPRCSRGVLLARAVHTHRGRVTTATTATTIARIGQHVDALLAAQVAFAQAATRAHDAFGPQCTMLVARSAIELVAVGVDAASVAHLTPLGTDARAFVAHFEGSAGHTAAATVARVREDVRAVSVAFALPSEATTSATDTGGAQRASVAALTAVVRVVERIDASPITLQKGTRAFAFTPNTAASGLAGVPALAAIAGIEIQVGALAARAIRLVRQAFGLAVVSCADLVCRTDGATRATVVVVGSRIDTLPVTERLPRGALTGAGYARLSDPTRAAALTAIGRIAEQIGTVVAAGGQATRAPTLAIEAHLLGATRHVTRAAVLVVPTRVDAFRAAALSRRRTIAEPRGALLAVFANGGARTAVQRIAADRNTGPRAVERARRAIANPGLALLTACTLLITRAAVLRVERKVDAIAIAIGSSRRAGADPAVTLLARRTRLAATAAMLDVADKVDAGAAALRERGRARIHALTQSTQRRTTRATLAAVRGVTLQIDALTVAHVARAAGTLPRVATLPCAAHDAARAAVLGIVGRTALTVAVQQTGGAGAHAVMALESRVARRGAVSTVLGVLL